MYILALEASTTSAKAMYYDTDTEKYELATQAYVGNYADETIIKPDLVFEQLMKVGRELIAGRKVDVISLGGTWHGAGLFNKDMTPATPVYQWNNTECTDLCARLRRTPGYAKDYYMRTGCMVNTTYGFFKLLMLKENQGYKLKDYYIMGQGSYNNYRLTGKRVTTDCLLAGSGVLNTHTKKYDEQVLKELEIDGSQFSEIITYKNNYPLIPEAAEKLGLPAGIPVLPTCSDGALNQTGSGALARGIMTCSIGTSCAVRLTTDGPVLPEECSTWCYLTPISWLCGAATNCGTSNIDWFKKCSFDPDTTYSQIEAHINEDEPTPVFLPFLYGERCPGWNDERRGGFMNLLPTHNRYHMYRAVQEGVLFNVYQCYEALTAVTGEPEHIRLSGGILHSESWTQMCADIFQKDMEIDKNEQASLLGAVVLAKEYLGIIDNVENYRPEAAKIIRCDPDKASVYKEKYDAYINCYNLQKLK